MAVGFRKKRPAFAQFRRLFLETAIEINHDQGLDYFSAWEKTGDAHVRALILARFKDELVEQFGMGSGLEIDHRLLHLKGPVESIITRLFHSYSTIGLVEHINETVLEKQKARREGEL